MAEAELRTHIPLSRIVVKHTSVGDKVLVTGYMGRLAERAGIDPRTARYFSIKICVGDEAADSQVVVGGGKALVWEIVPYPSACTPEWFRRFLSAVEEWLAGLGVREVYFVSFDPLEEKLDMKRVLREHGYREFDSELYYKRLM